jgi:3-mercaptopyruvate sulfurtransferase SseA
MAFNLKDISHEARHLPPRIVLLGTPKVGKTTWAANAPGAVLIPIKGEEGADDMTCAKFPTAQTFDDVMEALGTLATAEHGYQFVVIDSATAL